MFKFTFVGACALCLLVRSGSAQAPQPIPSQYQDAYNAINTNLAQFNTSLSALGNEPQGHVAYAPQLQTALSDLTTSLLQPDYYQVTVLSELNALQALGAKAVTFHINFPNLLPSYYSNPSDYQAYLNFYTTLMAEIRARGMKAVIENTTAVVYPGTNSAGFTPYYQSLNWQTYMSQRAELAANIAKLLQPDYLVVIAEPDTEANTTGQTNVNTVLGATQMLQGMLTAIQTAGAPEVKVVAGCGTWHPLFLQFIQSYVTMPLSVIDMHIYPVNKNNLPNALAAVTTIKAAGKQPSMSEFWSYKESDADYTSHLPYTTIYARDVYSFWGPTDISFLQTMVKFANYGDFAFLSPFWSHYFSAYIDYNTYGGQPDTTVIQAATTASNQARLVGAFTPTGLAWENLLIASPDKTAPQVPAAPALVAVSQTASSLSWSPTSDNVGVAAYRVYRNGVVVGTVNSPLTFPDLGLTPNTKYSYTLAAFDAAGNVSPQSAPLSVTTYSYPDKTPPSTPTGFKAGPVSDVSINLTWNAATDNVAVTGYKIYRGTSASNLSAYASSTTTSFTDQSVAPSKTYYYQVAAYDAANNYSPKSAVVSVSTPADTTPPSAPTNLSVMAEPGPSTNLSWKASTDNNTVASYQVYRGTSTSNLQVIGGGAALTFADTKVQAGKTYYYAVAAVDASKNVSAQSARVVVQVP